MESTEIFWHQEENCNKISNHTQSRTLLKENVGSRIDAMHKQFDYFDHTNYEQK